MKTPITLVWLDPFFQIIRIDRHITPWHIRSCKKAVSVIECSDDFLSSPLHPRDTIALFPLKK